MKFPSIKIPSQYPLICTGGVVILPSRFVCGNFDLYFGKSKISCFILWSGQRNVYASTTRNIRCLLWIFKFANFGKANNFWLENEIEESFCNVINGFSCLTIEHIYYIFPSIFLVGFFIFFLPIYTESPTGFASIISSMTKNRMKIYSLRPIFLI